MSRFLLRRLFYAIPVLIGILLVTFSLARAIPGDPCRAVLGERATDEICEAYFERQGLNEPIPIQFAVYARNIVLQGDFGQSLRFQRPVTELLAERLPVTIELTLTAIFFAVIVGIPLGIISAYRHNSAIDVGTMIGANIGVSMPVFWLGLMLSYIFGVALRDTIFYLPPSGRLSPGMGGDPFYEVWGLIQDPAQASAILVFFSRFNLLNAVLTGNWDLFVDAFRHLILPAAAVGTIPLAIIARMTRSSLLEILSQDYIRTGRAKGLRERTVVLRHGFRNALLPVVTIIGLNFGFLISGAVLTETVFGFTGIGKTLFDGITARDYTLVQGVTLITAVAFVFINLFVDVLYGFLDPRIRLS
jgi:peptide/nickel transport system permease protein